MKQIAVAFTQTSMLRRLASGSRSVPAEPSLIAAASAFVQLQDARHDEDYHLSRRFTRQEALVLADISDQAFRDWKQIRGGLQADTFLTGLLAYKNIR